MKFSTKKPVVLKNEFDYQMWELMQEFNKLMLHNAVVASYQICPCYQTKARLKALKRKD